MEVNMLFQVSRLDKCIAVALTGREMGFVRHKTSMYLFIVSYYGAFRAMQQAINMFHSYPSRTCNSRCIYIFHCLMIILPDINPWRGTGIVSLISVENMIQAAETFY